MYSVGHSRTPLGFNRAISRGKDNSPGHHAGHHWPCCCRTLRCKPTSEEACFDARPKHKLKSLVVLSSVAPNWLGKVSIRHVGAI
jgi:hypothetical protein